jgi:antitoxin (DNA-binding transcriptional repressor) of toxin-antitoxin stability system
MSIISLEEAQARLPELIAHLQPGEELIINAAGKPVAKLVRSERQSWPCQRQR